MSLILPLPSSVYLTPTFLSHHAHDIRFSFHLFCCSQRKDWNSPKQHAIISWGNTCRPVGLPVPQTAKSPQSHFRKQDRHTDRRLTQNQIKSHHIFPSGKRGYIWDWAPIQPTEEIVEPLMWSLSLGMENKEPSAEADTVPCLTAPCASVT